MNTSIGECGNPYSPQKNYFIDSIISAGASHINTGINTLFNYWNTNNTNEANARISKDTNDVNYKLWQEQLAAQREQYEKERLENRFLVDQAYQREIENRDYQNWYNSPKAQIERYLRAGINPYLAMSGLSAMASAGASSSVGSNPSMSPASPIPAAGYTHIPYSQDMLNGLIGSDAFQLFNDLAYRREALDQKWVDLLSKAPLDPATKDKFIRDKLFASDKTQAAQSGITQNEFLKIVNEVALQTLDLNMAQETNEQKRKEWNFINQKHGLELKQLVNDVNDYVIRHHILENQSQISDEALKIAIKESAKLDREENLWNGDVSFRSVFEMLRSIFSGSLLPVLIQLMK